VAGPARPPIEPLDSLPFPAHELITGPYRTHYPVRSRRRLRFGFVESGRGCPHACLFCSQTLRNTYGDRVRLREPGAVALEVGHLADRLGVNAVVFQDDTFCLDHGFAHALCDELVARGLAERVAWVVQTRVDAVDEDLLGHMRAAGCTTVCFGVESASQRVLDALRKGVTVDQTREAFRAARAAGLLTVGYFMLGCPGETREEAESTLALCHELEPDFVQVAFFTAYPGSPAWAEGHGDQPFERYTHYNAVVRNASAMDEAELGALHRRFYRSYLSSPRFIARYAANRLPVALANWREEAALARSAIGFLGGAGASGR
jgi:radical SAM superfamily enzyme YgiQ (UPF0313 family)